MKIIFRSAAAVLYYSFKAYKKIKGEAAMDKTERTCLLCGKKTKIVYNTKSCGEYAIYGIYCSCEAGDGSLPGLGAVKSRGLPFVHGGYAKENSP